MKVIESGHRYETADGQVIAFRSGSKPGATVEEVLDMLVARMEEWQQRLPDHFTFQAINQVRKARYTLLNRDVMRRDRGVAGTSLPTVDYEAQRLADEALVAASAEQSQP